MKKVAIIGAGVVGSTAAYYLSKREGLEVTVFDHGLGQATKAAAGIICPWFSKRRNKAWYKMARLGADFYQTLLVDLEEDGASKDFYQQTGVVLLKKNEEKLQELYDLAASRRAESPLIGDLKILDRRAVQTYFSGLTGFSQALYASGAARVEGSQLTASLLTASGLPLVKKQVELKRSASGYEIDGQTFDTVLLASGAWTADVLAPLGYQVDVRPQKGQLRDYFLEVDTSTYPVLMPEGELDLIPFALGKVSLGASHENDQGFDLTVAEEILSAFEEEGLTYYPLLAQAKRVQNRVGIRGYTSDFSPFFGKIPQENLYVAGGLGSSGLTTGPLIGNQLAQLIAGEELLLDPALYPVENYIRRM